MKKKQKTGNIVHDNFSACNSTSSFTHQDLSIDYGLDNIRFSNSN